MRMRRTFHAHDNKSASTAKAAHGASRTLRESSLKQTKAATEIPSRLLHERIVPPLDLLKNYKETERRVVTFVTLGMFTHACFP